MGKKLYIGNLSFDVNDESLAELFSQHGTVESARIVTDRDSGRSRGFAFIEMSQDAEASMAIDKLNGYELSGRSLTVSEAKAMSPREDRSGRSSFNRNRY